MLSTIFSAKFLAVVMAMALTASTVGIYAAAISSTSTKAVGSGQVQVTGGIDNVTVSWTLNSQGAISGASLSWTPNATGTLGVKVFDQTTCSGSLLAHATTTVTNANSGSVSFSSPITNLADVNCTQVYFVGS
ncbi:hypothetical protein HRbin23_01507 [bacterium HR23]|uniref:Uncharacterized protein n=1 Tax=uncultured prokaryote TaxID=198431 RepID=H5SLF7_9ZZZZ|nr:hypothetical protein HGMM_F46A05C32 [uncultured prokaryote]GBD11828.1 hypothetical protein HRbin23_01507 [bacterium HR23]